MVKCNLLTRSRFRCFRKGQVGPHREGRIEGGGGKTVEEATKIFLKLEAGEKLSKRGCKDHLPG